jgi:hypothetical protein
MPGGAEVQQTSLDRQGNAPSALAVDSGSEQSAARDAEYPNLAVAHFQFGRSSAHFEVGMTAEGLLAVGALVSGILLSVVPIVSAATRHLNRRS